MVGELTCNQPNYNFDVTERADDGIYINSAPVTTVSR